MQAGRFNVTQASALKLQAGLASSDAGPFDAPTDCQGRAVERSGRP